MFGYIETGKITNIGMVGSSVIGKNYVASLCGTARAYITNSCVEAVVKGNVSVGGVVGSSTSQIGECYVDAKILGNNRIGGIAGDCYSVLNCSAKAFVEGNNSVGGLAGRGNYLHNAKNNYVECNVSGQKNVGGFIGQIFEPANNRSATIENNISNSVVVGEDNSSTGSFIGGFSTVESVLFDFKNNLTLNQEINFLGGYFDTTNQMINYDMTAMLAGIEEIELKDISTNLQIGIKSESNSQINYNTNFEYNLGRIKRDGIDSDLALSLIDNFTDLLSSKQTELGSVSNRLESVLDEISTQYDNLVSARSTLRDADMAELSSTYIQQQILQEASATLMATANQMPAIALQLL